MQNSIGYRIKKLHLATRQVLDQTLIPYNLTQAPGEMIYYLLQQDGQTQARLGRTLKVSAPTITKMIDGLMEKGFVTRRGDVTDARRKKIYLTVRGSKFKDEITAEQNKVEAILCKGFTAQELVAIKQYIEQMQNNMDQILEERSDGAN